MKILFFILIIFAVTQAREPDVLPHHYEYGYSYTVGGSEWTFADTWVLCGVMTIATMVVMLPVIFDGKDERWPVYKFRQYTLIYSGFRSKLSPKFPTRSLCGSY